MEDLFTRLERYRKTIDYWWLWLIMGIAFFIIGIVIFRYPGETYIALSMVFGIMILASGIVQLMIGANAPKESGRGWMIASGVIETILGLILVFNVNVTAAVLPLFLGFWLLFRSLSMIGFASDLRGAGITGTGWTIFWAVLLMICALVTLIFPAIGVGAIVIWLGISLLLAGISMIFFAFYLRSQKKHLIR